MTVKNIPVCALILFTALQWACGPSHRQYPLVNGEGWLSDDTYVLRMTGAPGIKENDPGKRREQALAAAERNGRSAFITRFSQEPHCPDALSGTYDQARRGAYFTTVARSAKATGIECDHEQNCMVSITFSAESLRRWALTCWADRPSIESRPQGKSTTAADRYPAAMKDPDRYLAENQGAFFSDDRYLLKCTAPADIRNADTAMRKQRTRQAAVLMARIGVTEELYRMENLYADPTPEYSAMLTAYRKELKALTATGTVLLEKFDAGMNCTVIYEVKRKKMRAWVEGSR